MNAIQILKIIGEMGFKMRPDRLNDMIDYFALMLYDERIIVISKDSKPCAVIAYSMTDNEAPYLIKDEWQYMAHDTQGRIVYIEKLISTGWNKELRNIFENEITYKYPQIESGIWHRYASWGDRKVIAKRRLKCTK